jgi:hypothetical protein
MNKYTTMSATNTKIIAMLEKLTEDVAALKVQVEQMSETNETNNETAYRALSKKLDLLKNLDNNAQATAQQVATTKTAKPTRPIYFKTIFNEDQTKYIGVLYTQEEIDTVCDSDKVKTKSGAVQPNRIANIIYTEYIRKNPERMKAFDDIYTKHFS